MNKDTQPIGFDVLFNPALNKGTAFTEEERDKYKLRGLLPPRVTDPDVQLHRALENMRRKYYDIERYIFLSALQSRNDRSENTQEDAPDAQKTMLGAEQLAWLTTALAGSSATWKIVSTDVPLSAPTGSNPEQNGRDAWANGRGDGFSGRTGFERELVALLRSIDEHNVRNVVFLATDVHFAAHVRYDVDLDGDGDRLVFHELVSGPLSAVRAPAPPAFDPTLHPRVESVTAACRLTKSLSANSSGRGRQVAPATAAAVYSMATEGWVPAANSSKSEVPSASESVAPRLVPCQYSALS